MMNMNRFIVFVCRSALEDICEGRVDLLDWVARLPYRCMPIGVSPYQNVIDTLIHKSELGETLVWYDRIPPSGRKDAGAIILTSQYGDISDREKKVVGDIARLCIPVFVVTIRGYCRFDFNGGLDAGIHCGHHRRPALTCHAHSSSRVYGALRHAAYEMRLPRRTGCSNQQ